jgi:hypothetical protein
MMAAIYAECFGTASVQNAAKTPEAKIALYI